MLYWIPGYADVTLAANARHRWHIYYVLLSEPASHLCIRIAAISHNDIHSCLSLQNLSVKLLLALLEGANHLQSTHSMQSASASIKIKREWEKERNDQKVFAKSMAIKINWDNVGYSVCLKLDQ